MKLTNTMKERIIKSIMDDTFSGRKSAIDTESAALADGIYSGFYEVHSKKMAGLPEEFFTSKSYFDVRIDGERFSKTLHMSTSRRFGKCHDYSSLYIAADSPFAPQLKAMEQKTAKFNEDMQRLKSTLNSVILPITTDKRLAEVWPDAEKWIPRTPAAMSNLPAVRPEDLNAMVEKMRRP